MATVNEDLSKSPSLNRFNRDLGAIVAQGTRIGIAVSGGPDSIALLLLAAQVRPLEIEAATVDHALREGSQAEAEMVAQLCEQLGVPHKILTAAWNEMPMSAIQERARTMRYRLLGEWARERNIDVIATAHHLDDQAETLVMRLARGAGVRGLAGMRRLARSPGNRVAIARPLLGWKHSELEEVCVAAGIETAKDPSNEDEQFERVRIRKALREAEWLDPKALAESAAHLAEADSALQWAATMEWQRRVSDGHGKIVYNPSDAPREIRRRIIRRAIFALASEGRNLELRGRELDQILAALVSGRKATLRGVLCSGGPEWQFVRAPARRQHSASAELGAVEG